MKTPRPISAIASDILDAWPRPNYAAVPYLSAMRALGGIDDRYIHDSAREIVLRFLCNASAFRGDRARALKAELRGMLKAAPSRPAL